MSPSRWDDEAEESTPPSSPPPAVARRGKFNDEEEEDSDVLESWDAADDSETERQKAAEAAAAAAKAQAAAAQAPPKKSRSQRIEERRTENMRRRQAEDEAAATSSDDEDDAERRARLRREQKEADLAHAEALFGDAPGRTTHTRGAVVAAGADGTQVELGALPLFQPASREQFNALRDVLMPLLAGASDKPQYALFVAELAKGLAMELPAEQVRKVASGLTTLANEKMKEEKAADKAGKKTKAARTKTSLNTVRDVARADVTAYDDGGLDDGDFM